MIKSKKYTFLLVAILFFVICGCGESSTTFYNNNQTYDEEDYNQQMAIKEPYCINQAETFTNLLEYPNDYLIDLDDVYLNMDDDDFFYYLDITNLNYSNIVYEDITYDIRRYTFNAYQNEHDIEATVTFNRGFDNNSLREVFYEYKDLSSDEAREIFTEIENYYDSINVSSPYIDENSFQKVKEYSASNFIVSIGISCYENSSPRVWVAYDTY